MVYLDYSATTPVNEEVLDSFCKATKTFIGNANSLHTLGVESKKMIDKATKQIASLLQVKENELIYTSGASEANNLAIKGICLRYQNRGKHIITTQLEHSSILEPLEYLKTLGFTVDYVKLQEDGRVDLEHLKSLMREDTILVTIASVSSELGIEQPIKEISEIVREYPKCFFHSDMTQSIGKIEIPLSYVDLASFSAHKFYGIKGIGCLVKKEKIELLPLIHGGESTSIYRSGTPALPLIVSLAKALRLSLTNLNRKIEYVTELQQYLISELQKNPEITINSTDYSIPYIVNFSVTKVKPETLLHALEEYEIYISTKSACSSHSKESKAVFALTHDKERSGHSLRVSISVLTTKEEIDYFIEKLNLCLEELILR